jgi:hypothetical protein
MAKFEIEFDSDTKQVSLKADGQDISASDFSIGKYSFKDQDGNDYYCVYMSFSIRRDDNSAVTYSYSYDTKSKILAEISSNYSVAKEIGKLVQQAKNADKLSNAIAKKQPVAVVNFEDLIIKPQIDTLKGGDSD